MNKFILSGNLTRDPNYTETKSGIPCARFGVAVNRPFSKNNDVDFFNVVAWNKTAELCNKYLAKGRRVIIEGRLQTNSYEKGGVKYSGYDVVVDSIEFADSKPKNSADEVETPPPDDFELPF